MRYVDSQQNFSFLTFLDYCKKSTFLDLCQGLISAPPLLLQATAAESSKLPFVVKPLKLGAEVLGIDLKNDVPPETVTLIKQLVTKHRLLVFRGQVPIFKPFREGVLDTSVILGHVVCRD